jgi:hypothetical protein
MAASFGSKTITDTATKILDANDVYRPVFIQIMGNHTVYLGDTSDVATSTGFPVVKHADAITGQLAPGQELWGICASGQTEDLRYFTHVD